MAPVLPPRTPTIDVDGDFTYECAVTKTTTLSNGRRLIRGVASGATVDRDGERVSKTAIAKMAAQPTANGAIKLTSSHQQDWSTEIGDVVKMQHDVATDELVIEAELPAEGHDAVADKAWTELVVKRRPLGFSIGGKCRKAYFELVNKDTGRPQRQKVLDEVYLHHIMLTANPSCHGTFAEAIAKSFTGEAPEDEAAYTVDGVDEDLEVAKALADLAADVAKAGRDDDSGDDAPAPVDDAPEQPPAATAEAPAPEGDQAPSDAEDAAQLPMARHLSCPNCGHEFAADMPADVVPEDDKPEPDTPDTAKTAVHKEIPMANSADETLAKIRALATADAEVTKTEGDAAPAELAVREGDTVAKTDEPTEVDVLKSTLAAAHLHSEARHDALAEQLNKGFEVIAKALAAMPQGRKSVARVLPTNGDVEKSATETDDVAKAANPVDALKALNAQTYGIR